MGKLISKALTMLLRGRSGSLSVATAVSQQRPLQVYEFEGCPFCRKVREAITHLDLQAVFYPCPKGGDRYRATALSLSGQTQFPFIVDPDNGTSLLDSDAIVTYLYTRYADGRRPWLTRMAFLDNAGSGFASMIRAYRGSHSRPSRFNAVPIELFCYESQPDAFAIRERLTTLQLCWKFTSTAPGARAHDSTQPQPRLVDPNSTAQRSGTAAIVDYLEQTYAL